MKMQRAPLAQCQNLLLLPHAHAPASSWIGDLGLCRVGARGVFKWNLEEDPTLLLLPHGWMMLDGMEICSV